MTRKKSRSFDGGPVGYKRPPVEHQFKPGERPKGSGRRKGSRNASLIVEELMAKTVVITENGKKRRVPVLEALLRKALAAAVNGSPREIAKFLDLVERYAPHLVRPEDRPIEIRLMPGEGRL